MSQLRFIATICATVSLSNMATTVSHAYTFTTIPWTIENAEAWGINDNGEISGNEGIHTTSCASNFAAFVYSGQLITVFQQNQGCVTFGASLNNSGTSVGWTFDTSNIEQAYTRTKSGKFTLFSYPGAPLTNFVGINNKGAIVGSFGYSAANEHGLLYKSGKWKQIDYPGAVYIAIEGINDSGVMVGGYQATDGTIHGLVFNNGNPTLLNVPNAPSTGAQAINDEGVIVGSFVDSAGVGHGFMLNTNGSYTTIDFPQASNTGIDGINNSGTIVGTYVDASGNRHAFMAQ